MRSKFASIEDILAEMRSIRCIEHEGRLKFITPFVGPQVDICKAFGFDIPDGCAPTYTSRKKSPSRPGPADRLSPRSSIRSYRYIVVKNSENRISFR